MTKGQPIDLTPTVETISYLLNTPEEWDSGLDELLLEKIEWSEVAPETIIPKLELRRFTKSIMDKEVRLNVMRFLYDYAEYYFTDGAKDLAFGDGHPISPNVLENRTRDYIGQFRSELSAQISQIEKTGEYSGNKFSKLQKRISELEKQVEELKAENKKLATKVDRFEHPYRHKLFIPEELQEEEFWFIMEYLQSKQIVFPYQDRNEYGLPHVACYIWCKNVSKALFGYFVDRVSYELDLYKDKHIQWKLFRPAFENFKDLEKQAKDVVSKYSSWANPKVPLPKGYEIIEEAVKYAEGKMDKNAEKPAARDKQVIVNRM